LAAPPELEALLFAENKNILAAPQELEALLFAENKNTLAATPELEAWLLMLCITPTFHAVKVNWQHHQNYKHCQKEYL
jgi:hypothetical protein